MLITWFIHSGCDCLQAAKLADAEAETDQIERDIENSAQQIPVTQWPHLVILLARWLS